MAESSMMIHQHREPHTLTSPDRISEVEVLSCAFLLRCGLDRKGTLVLSHNVQKSLFTQIQDLNLQ